MKTRHRRYLIEMFQLNKSSLADFIARTLFLLFVAGLAFLFFWATSTEIETSVPTEDQLQQLEQDMEEKEARNEQEIRRLIYFDAVDNMEVSE